MAGLRFFAGIDGGGSKTSIVLVDEGGQELGRGQAGGSNYQAVGLERAVANLQTGLTAARQAARLPEAARPAALVAGLAGLDRPADYSRWRVEFDRLNLADRIELSNDAELILYALHDRRGLGLICGTGSIALGRDLQDNRGRAGGWGHFFGDEGSGLWLGRQALNLASRAADGRGPHTTLLPLILEAWQLDEPSDLIGAVYGNGPVDNARVARLAGLVFQAQAEGDELARLLVNTSVNELALTIKACDRELFFLDPPDLALAGGLLLNYPTFQAALITRLNALMTIGAVVAVADPALVAARAAAGLK